LGWLAADYTTELIRNWFAEKGWPELSDTTLSYYRKQCRATIDKLRKDRRESALNTGLALREERVARLKQHADELDAIKWEADERGRLWNEKVWRETLDDIAKETGGRKQTVEVSGDVVLTIVTPEQVAQARKRAQEWEKENFGSSGSPGELAKPDPNIE
jgi:hypothetical protein